MYLVDTNIFLEILLEQERADECETLVERLREGDLTALVSSFTLHSIEVIMERTGRHDLLLEFLKDVDSAKGLRRFDTTTLDELDALRLGKSVKLDFDDSIQYFICETHNLKIISFDRHFDNKDIMRIEPIDVLE
ncbi:MAG: type II toxin-antitoxin system VapC family toxin [Deltaproteobacteria bacterium]|nr:type II toxin-antitoxin system VapC family toxin [Deltaproteobacteria bacterium]